MSVNDVAANHPASAQIRGARAMLGWSVLDLAEAAEVSAVTVKLVETEDARPLPMVVRLSVASALRAAGVQVLPDEDRGPGVCSEDAHGRL